MVRVSITKKSTRMEIALKIILGTITGCLTVGFFLYLLIGPKNFRFRRTRMGEIIHVAGYKEEDYENKSDDEKMAIYIRHLMKENPHLMKKEFESDEDMLEWVKSIIPNMSRCYVSQTGKGIVISDPQLITLKLEIYFIADIRLES